MAKKKSGAGKLLPQLANLNVPALLGERGLREWLKAFWPGLTIDLRNIGNGVVRCSCLHPDHADGTASMDIDTRTGSIHCWGCGYRVRDFFQFMADVKQWTFKQTVDELHKFTSTRLISDAAAKSLIVQDVFTEALRVLAWCASRHMLRCYSAINQPGSVTASGYEGAILESAARTLDYLRGRGHEPGLMTLMAYGMWPAEHMFPAMVSEYFDEEAKRRALRSERVERAFRGSVAQAEREWKVAVQEKVLALAKEAGAAHLNSLVYVTGHAPTVPARIRLRNPHVPKSEGIKLLSGVTEDASPGWFGLFNPNFMGQRKRDDADFFVIVVEGEHDALTLNELLAKANISGVCVIASCGTANDLSTLADIDISQVSLWADEPNEGKGDAVIYQLSKTAARTDARPLSREGWEELRQAVPDAKDPDDVIRGIGDIRPLLYRILFEQRKKYFISSSDWAMDQIQQSVEKKGIDLDDKRALMDVIGHFGQCVPYPIAQAAFVERLAKTYGIAPGELRKEIIQRNDTEEAFRLRITEQMFREFHPLYVYSQGNRVMLRLFHRTKERTFSIALGDGEAIMLCLANLHGNIFDYTRTIIGLPAFMAVDPDAPNVTPEKDLMKNISFYYGAALQEFSRDVLNQHECKAYPQGFHILFNPKHNEQFAYVFNGHHVYRARFLNNVMQPWEELPGPSDGPILFDFGASLQMEPYSKEIQRLGDLQEGMATTPDDIRKAAHSICEVFEQNWTFGDQRLDPKILAYTLVAWSVGAAFEEKAWLHLLGEFRSGKSKVLQVFTDLLEACKKLINPSVAAFYQALHNLSQAVLLDEADTVSSRRYDPQTEHTVQIMFVCREMFTLGGTRVPRGTLDRQEVYYNLHTHMLTAAMTKTDVRADDSRMLKIHLKHDATRLDPSLAMYRTLSREVFAQIRRLLSIGTLQYALQLREAAREIAQEVADGVLSQFPSVSTRQLRSLYPAAAVMKLCGEDWLAFLSEALITRRDMHQQTVSDSVSADLLNSILATPVLLPTEDGKVLTNRVRDLLRTEFDTRLLNSSKSGIYYYEAQGKLIFEWHTMRRRNGPLDNWPEYRVMRPDLLKHAMDGHERALRTDEYAAYGIDKFLIARTGHFQAELFSVLDYGAEVLALRTSKAAEAAATAAEPQKGKGEKSGDGGNNLI